MTLNSKIGLSLVLPMLVGLCLLGWLIQAQLMQRFATLESAELRQQHERLEQAIAADFDSLQRLASDWGEYDETYAYMQGNNPEFIEANISWAALDNLQLDAIALLDNQNRLHAGFALTPAGSELQPISDELASAIERAAGLLPDPSQGFGVVDVGERVLAVAISAILTTDGEGPAQGKLVMARYLSDGTVEELAKRIRSHIRFEPINVDDAAGQALRTSLADSGYVQRPLSDKSIASYSLLNGLDGKPALLMRVSIRRDILREGESAVNTLLGVSALAYLILVLAMFAALQWVAIRRIRRVARELRSIRNDEEVQHKRITVVGRDEISALSRSINNLLQRLVEAFEERHRLNERQRKLNALLVEIATDETLADCDAQTLCQVLQQPFNIEIGLQHWSLWLDDADGEFQCLSESDPKFARGGALRQQLQGRTEWPSNCEPFSLPAEDAEHQRLAFGLRVENRRGALVVDYQGEPDASHEEDLAFLMAATQLIERSLSNHYQRKREQQLRRDSEIDGLTQLANRSKFELELSESLRRPSAVGSIAVLFIDLDRFKPINDLYGHVVGDAVLREVAIRLRAAIREADLVGRLGGDEFVVLLRSVKNVAAVERVGEKLIKALSRPIEVPGKPALAVGCSIGAALAPMHANQADALIHLADQAMYRAKQTEGLHFAMARDSDGL